MQWFCPRRLSQEVAELKRQIDAVNRERKLQQTAAGGELAGLEDQWKELVAKNGEIERACRAMEEEVVLMQAASHPAPQCVACSCVISANRIGVSDIRACLPPHL